MRNKNNKKLIHLTYKKKINGKLCKKKTWETSTLKKYIYITTSFVLRQPLQPAK